MLTLVRWQESPEWSFQIRRITSCSEARRMDFFFSIFGFWGKHNKGETICLMHFQPAKPQCLFLWFFWFRYPAISWRRQNLNERTLEENRQDPFCGSGTVFSTTTTACTTTSRVWPE